MDILDYIEADHDAIRSLIIELKIADEDSEHEAEAFTALVSVVKSQNEAQEKIFIPLATRSDELRSVVTPTLERFESAKKIEHIIECCTNHATWRASVNIYCEMLENGLEKERRELLPLVFDKIHFDERRKLGRAYRKLRGFGTRRLPIDPQDQVDWPNLWSAVINQAG